MFRRLSLQTAGESHGRGIVVTLAGIPSGLKVDSTAINAVLKLRQSGFGRSERQQLEHDQVDILAGVYRGQTTGAPLALAVWNVDQSLDERPAVSAPRPGHADLAGGQKYQTRDMRGVLERASARETAGRVAAGALASLLLQDLGLDVLGYVIRVGSVPVPAGSGRKAIATLRRQRNRSPFHVLDPSKEGGLEKAVRTARKAGDSLGGIFEVRAEGVPPGLGALDDCATRLDASLGAAIMSIPAIKAVEIGDGVASASEMGSAVHDPLGRPGRKGPTRLKNRAGGIEGGMSNGEAIVVRGFMKPLSTLAKPLQSWDFGRNRPSSAFFERADVTAVPAAAIVGEAMVALVLTDALLGKMGGDTLAEVRASLRGHRRSVERLFGRSGTGKKKKP